MSDPIVRVEGLVKDFRPGFGLRRKRVLHGIDFEVAEGELFAVIGPNGAGKTTTLKVLLGLIRASAGQTHVLGYDVRETAYRRHVGFAPEAPYFYDFLTAREILGFYAKLGGVPSARRGDRIETVLDQVGLCHAADARLRTYSKGMLQRVGIAQALVHDPDVIFLDEPMGGLDPLGRKEIRDLIVDLNAAGKTIMMNTHILSDVEMICDRVAILVAGRIAYRGPVAGVGEDGDRDVEATFASLQPDFVEELVSRTGATIVGRGERITLHLSAKDADETVQAALARGASLLDLSPVGRDLESMFLRAVDESAARAAEDDA
jgi:ABC-2 type transport system ATP-binding protein